MSILCPTDFSQPALAAADTAAALATKMKLPMRLLHCGKDWIGEVPMLQPADGAVRAQLKNEADRLRTTGIEVTEEFRRGNASIEIISAAEEQPTHLILMGSTGTGKAERWLIGSVAERVAEGATVPTLVVRDPAGLQDWLSDHIPLRLFCGVDFTVSADVALAATVPLLSLGTVELEAAHVRPAESPVVSKEQQIRRQQEVWQRMRTVLGDRPVNVQVCYSSDHPAVEFIHQAEEHGANLIVVGTHQRHGLRRLFVPSFSRSVLAHAKTNVLCVPVVSGQPDTHIPAVRRVLLATNFTPVCTEALRHAQSLLPTGGAIHLVHVVHEPTSGLNPVLASEIYFDQSLATEAEKSAAEQQIKSLPAALLAAPNVAITTEILAHHDVAAAICDAADRNDADIICMGTKAHSRTSVALLGSTVQDVIAGAHRPVFVIPLPRL
jgi:nucleotide-binding universal stress UspA family protein